MRHNVQTINTQTRERTDKTPVDCHDPGGDITKFSALTSSAFSPLPSDMTNIPLTYCLT